MKKWSNQKQLVLNGYTVFELWYESPSKFVMSEIVSYVRRVAWFIKHNFPYYGVDETRIALCCGGARGHSPELKQASKGVAEAWARFDRHLNKE